MGVISPRLDDWNAAGSVLESVRGTGSHLGPVEVGMNAMWFYVEESSREGQVSP